MILFLTTHPIKIAILALLLFFAIGIYLEWPESYRPPAPEEGVYQVLLTAKGATPDALVVPVGEYVQMNSADGRVYNIGYGRGDSETKEHEHLGGVLDSGDFGAGEAFKVQIKEPGTFYFHDHYNAKTIVTVVGFVPDVTTPESR